MFKTIFLLLVSAFALVIVVNNAIKSEPPSQEAVLLRRNDHGGQPYFVDVQRSTVEVLSTQDVDVSFDRKTFYHMFGRACRRNCPNVTMRGK